ncbi:MAG: type II and III secretion system protein [Verrucomicrobiales bacterium]|nr:type II and III secretion system protein [Verrucomicrobiales bacterium]
MKSKLLVLTLAAVLMQSWSHAQMGREMALLNSPAYESAATPLRGAPPRQYNFSKAVLSDVMRLMAEDAGIGFFGLPDGTAGGDRLVTFTLNASPFVALETLAKANGVALIYEGGIWYLRPANDQELIGRIYEINYNAQELVTKNSQGGGTQGGGFGGGAGGGGGASAGLDLQGSPDFFVTEPSRILEDIQNILDIEGSGGNARFAPTASVDNVAQLSVAGLQGSPDLVNRIRPGGSEGSDDGGGQSKVIWNSDSNSLYVVATRQQHQWIEAYLASVDKPQPMIAVEVKFIETSRNPSSDLGIDWDGVLGDTGLDLTLSDNAGPLDLNQIGSYSLPTAVLSYSDLTLKLRAIYGDRNTKSVSFPRMVTLDNREVSFRSVINQPVLGSSASASLGAGATQTSAIEYLPIGTVINVLPKRMSNDKILLNVSVTVSDIVGTEIINGNPFPIATSRVYTAPLTVKSGFTVAISGLDAARSEETERGVPILGRLPVLGYAFKRKGRDRNRQHLMMLITPIALHTGTEGLTEKPVIKEPWKYDYSSAKSAVNDLPARTNRDLHVQPIHDIPAFDEAHARKASQTFGQAQEPIIAKPVEANQSTMELGAAAVRERIEAPVIDAANTPMTVDTLPVPEEAITEAPAEVVSVGDPAPMIDDAKLQELKKGIEKVESTLSSVPEGEEKLTADDAQAVVNAFDEASSLLETVDSLRGEGGKPLQGELGDAWWDLINLKTRAVKESRRSPESLVLTLDDDKADS